MEISEEKLQAMIDKAVNDGLELAAEKGALKVLEALKINLLPASAPAINRVRFPKFDPIIIAKMERQILLDHNERIKKKKNTENRKK